MGNRLADFVKSTPLVYKLYFRMGSAAVRLLGRFIRCDNRTILFNCFGGKKFDDSPKAIYDAMRADPRFRDANLVWVFNDPGKVPFEGKKVRNRSLAFFRTALSAKVWITNSSMEQGLRFKKKETYYLNTWHGTAIKKLGADMPRTTKAFGASLSPCNVMLAQSQYDVDVFSHAFGIPKPMFRMTGLPRNDELVNHTQLRVAEVKQRLGIPEGKRVLLYAPTFREYSMNTLKENTLNLPIHGELWQERLGGDYVILFRAHYAVSKTIRVKDYEAFIDVSDYPNLADLMIVSDLLLTDYSSIMIDYSVMRKPIFCFAYDYDEYLSKRGTYFDMREELPCEIVYDEDTLLAALSAFDEKTFDPSGVDRFREKFATCCGSASKQVCDLIWEQLHP